MQTSVLSEGIFLAYVPLRLQPSENVSAFLIPCQWLRGFENSLPNSQFTRHRIPASQIKCPSENACRRVVINSRPETVHRGRIFYLTCGSLSGLPHPLQAMYPIHKIVGKRCRQSYFIDGCRRIKIERKPLLCEQAPNEVFRSIFAWLVAILNSRFIQSNQ